MTRSPNRSSLSIRVVRAMSALKSLMWKRWFRTSIYESIRPSASSRIGWLETLSSLIAEGSENVHRGGVLKVSAKERAKRSAAREFRRRFVMAEQLELRALMAADLGLDPQTCDLSESVQIGAMVAGTSQNDVVFKAQTAIAQADEFLRNHVVSGRFEPLASSVFAIGQNPVALAELSSLVSDIRSGDFSVDVAVRTASELQGKRAAYTSSDPSGLEQIYLNGDWLASNPSQNQVLEVVLEEVGHAIDYRLNGPFDTAGDEGYVFAQLALQTGKDVSLAQTQDDHFMATIDGSSVLAEASAGSVVQQHFVPMRERDVYDSLRAINSSVGTMIWSIVSITATSDGTTVYYDHWEDGYDSVTTTPGSTSRTITLNAGQTFIFRNLVDLTKVGTLGNYDLNGNGNTTDAGETNTYYADGRDLISSTAPVSVVRAAWAANPGSVLAGAVNVIDTTAAGTSFRAPVGQNTVTAATDSPSNRLFEYSSLHIVAYANNTRVRIDKDANGVFETTVTLNRGETYTVAGALQGAQVVAEDSLGASARKPIGVYMITGDVGSSFENRWFSLPASGQWDSTYYAPVGSTRSTDPASVFLYNPNASAINVLYDTRTTRGLSVTVPANGTSFVTMPTGNTGAKFYTTGGQKFYAVSAIDSDATSNQAHDWSYSLIPGTNLTTKWVLGWAPGTSETGTITANGSPAWVTAPNDTTIYINYNGTNSAPLTAPNGEKYNVAYSLKALESYRVFDPDRDQTGLTVFTADGTVLAGAWGQDPSSAQPGNPFLDLGYTAIPFPDFVVTKSAAEAAGDNDGNVEIGERIRYTINVSNRALLDLSNIQIVDALSPDLRSRYVVNSSTLAVFDRDGNQVGSTSTIPDSGSYPFNNLSLDTDPNTAGTQGLQSGFRAQIQFDILLNSGDAGLVSQLAAASGLVTSNLALTATPGTGSPVTKNLQTVTQVGLTTADGLMQITNAAYSSSVGSIDEDAVMYLRVADADANRVAGTAETITVEVLNSNTNTSRTVTLTETGANTGVFTGSITTTTNGSDPSIATRLLVNRGDTIQASYTDPVYGATFDNPFVPGVPGGASPGNANVATATVAMPAKTKILYLAADGSDAGTTPNLNRIDPVAANNSTTLTTPAITPAGTGTSPSSLLNHSTNDNEYEVKSGQYAAQSFTIAGSGTFVPTGLQLQMAKDSGFANETLTVTIRTAVNGGTVLYQGTVSTNSGTNAAGGLIPTDANKRGSLVTVQGLTAQNGTTGLNLGTAYFIQVVSSNSAGKVFWVGSGSNAYAGGAAYLNSTTADTGKDWRFQLNYNVPASLPAVTQEFVQEIPLAAAFSMPSGGLVRVVAHVTEVTGLTGSLADVKATLRNGSTTILALANPTFDSSAGTLTWTGTLSSNVNLASGVSLGLLVANDKSSSSFKINYNSKTSPSRIELPTTTVIAIEDVAPNNVGTQLVGFFDSPFVNDANATNDGTLISAVDAGSTVYIRTRVSDPFGDYDIASLGLRITGPDGSTSVDDLALTTITTAADTAGDAFKIFEYVWATGNFPGPYTIDVIATEGNESTPLAIATAIGAFTVTAQDLGTQSITQWVTLAGSDATAVYPAGTTTAYLQVTDLDENTNAATVQTVTATVNGASFTLTETGANTGIFRVTIASGTNGITVANGSVLSAVYVDKDTSSDTSSDVVSVGTAAPILDLDVTSALQLNSSETYVENSAPVELITSDGGTPALISGAGITSINSISVRIASTQILDGANEILSVAGGRGVGASVALNTTETPQAFTFSGISLNNTRNTSGGDNIFTFTKTTGTFTLAEASALIAAMRYQVLGHNPTAGVRNLRFAVVSGTTTSNTATSAVTVQVANDAPWIDLDNSTLPRVAQTTAVTYATSYFANNVVNLVVDGVTYSHTVVTGGTTASAVHTALLNVVGNNGVALRDSLRNKGVTWPTTLTSNGVSLTGAVGTANAFTITGSSDGSNPTTPTINTSTAASDGSSSFSTTFTEVSGNDTGANAVAIADTDVSIADPDDTIIEGARIVLTNPLDGSAETLSISGSLPAGITASSYDAATGVLTLSGTAALASYETAIEAIRYNNSSNVPSTTSRVIQIYVNDGEIDSNIAQSTIAVSAVNDPPTASNFTATALEDTSWVAQLSDFTSVYSDPESNALASIAITGLATAGTLEFYNGTSWVSVTANQVITAASLTSGFLRFRPAANANGLAYATFQFTVSNGVASSSPASTVTINITPVNDAPEGNSVTPSLNAYVGGFITLTESNFGFNDPIDVPNNNFHSVKFTNVPERPVQGVLANEGAVQTQVGSVSNSRTGTLEGARDIRTSAYSQSTTTGNPQFVDAETGSFVIEGVGTFNKRLLGRYGTMYLNSATGGYYFEQFTGGSTGYQYIASYSGTAVPFTPVYEDLNIPTGVRVTDGFLFDVGDNGSDFLRRTLTITLTGNGSGFNYESSIWKTVVDNEFVSKDTIVANHVRYSPCFCGVARFKTDGSFQIGTNGGALFTTIEYQVQDDGGTANGGVDLDPTPNKIEITLIDGFSPVVNVPSEQYFNEDTSLSFNGFGASNALYVTYNPPGVPSNQINDVTVVVELDSASRPGTLALDGGIPSGVTATTSSGRTTKFEIVGTVAFVDSVLANLVFTPDLDQFSTIDRGVNADPRYPGLNGIGSTDAYAILKVSAKNNPLTGQTQYPTTRADVDMSVINVNDAPVVTGSNPSMTILEDTPTSSTIASLFAGNFSDTKDSYPNPNPNYPTAGILDGVAITAYTPNAAQGNWQYSPTGSVGTWTNLTAQASDATAFAIPASYHLRFNPVANYNGAMPSLTVRLIETGATAVSVGLLDVSSNGGTTRVSSGTVVLSGSVTAVNDAPIASGTASLASISEDATAPAGASVASLFGSNFNDSADQMGGSSANEFAGVTIVGYTRSLAAGEWQYDVDGGSTWTTLGSVVDDSVSRTFKGTDRLRFLPSTNFNGQAPVLVVRLLETPRSVTTNAQVDVSSNGGSTTISADPVTLTHLVTAVNDAPVASGSATLSSILEDNLSGPGATVGQLFSLNFNDQKDSVANGSNANSLAAVALVGYAEDTLKGTWQYSANGTDWTTLTSSPTQNSATTIPAGHRLRFVPAANFNGPAPTLSVLLIDSSAGSVNFATGVNISAIGGTTQYSLGQVILNHSVTSVNDAPAGTDKTVSVSSDASYVFMDSDFGFTDPVDSPANRFAKLRVTTLPTVGTLSLNGQPVTSGDLIALSDMIAGKFVFVPPQTGSTSASFTFQVQDDGGTANNGVNLDGSANTLTIEIVVPTPSDLSVVSYSSINEKRTSPTEMFHMFKVVAEPGATVILSIGSTAANDVEANWNDFSIEYSLDKSSWLSNPSGGITTQSGDIYVRVNTISEWDGMVTNDSYLEGPERFQLNAIAGALTAFGIGEIRDDGTGGVYSGAWVGSDPESLSGRLDDDRVWAVNDPRLSNVLQVVTVDVRSNDGSKNAAISDEIDLNPATPNTVESELVISGQGTWRVVNGDVKFTRLSSFTRDPNPISYAIRPADRPGNFVETTATVTIDFPVVTRSDSNATPEATLTAPVTLDVLANDNLGDTPVASTLRFADGTADGATTLVVAHGTWDIADGKIRFTPGTSGGQSLVRDQDPAPVGYFVKDAQGNKSSTTTASVTYQRSISEGLFVVLVNVLETNPIPSQTNALSGNHIDSFYDVRIVDNMPAGRPVVVNGVSFTTNQADSDSAVGRIQWSKPTNFAMGLFTRVTVDAKSKPFLSGTFADISLVGNATSTSTQRIQFVAMDMGFQLNAGSYSLASPISGMNNGTLNFTETVGISNQAFPTAVAPNTFNTMPQTTNRSVSWSGSKPLTLTGTPLSLMKTIQINHLTSTRTTQFNAGGKLVANSSSNNFNQYTDWVLPASMAWNPTNPLSRGPVEIVNGIVREEKISRRDPVLIPSQIVSTTEIGRKPTFVQSQQEMDFAAAKKSFALDEQSVISDEPSRLEANDSDFLI